MAKLDKSYILTLLTVCNDVPVDVIDGQIYATLGEGCRNVTNATEAELQNVIEQVHGNHSNH